MAIDIHEETNLAPYETHIFGENGAECRIPRTRIPTNTINYQRRHQRLRRWQGIITEPHVPPKAKTIIHLCMAGGPSHLETLDYKPKLAELHGQPMPKSFTEGQPIAQLQGQANKLKCLGPTHEFQKFGESGQEMSTAFPHIGSLADDICIVRSLKTEQINHDPGTHLHEHRHCNRW